MSRFAAALLWLALQSGLFAATAAFAAGPGQAAGAPIRDAIGNFYGLTYAGGTTDTGTVYRLSASGEYQILHEFDGSAGFATLEPHEHNLALRPNGVLYGITPRGGSADRGTLFRINSDGTGFRTLHEFGCSDGGYTGANLTLAPNGDLYGTAAPAPGATAGTLFRIDATDTYRVAYDFAVNTDPGLTPQQGVSLGSNGSLYGLASGGPTSIAYRIDPTGQFSSSYRFLPDNSPNPSRPFSPLTVTADGSLYGIAIQPASRTFILYKIDPTGRYSALADRPPGGIDTVPAALTVGSDGKLYGTVANYQSSPGSGFLYRVDATGTVEVLHTADFAPEDNFAGLAYGLVPANDGLLYSATLTLPVIAVQPERSALYSVAPSGEVRIVYRFPRDPKPPRVSVSVTGAHGLADWFTGPVTVRWGVFPEQAWAVTASTGCAAATLTAETPGTTLTCNATSAGGTTTVSRTIRIDTAPPTLVCPADVRVVQGQVVQLGEPVVTDTVDSAPRVTNDAPGSYAVGVTTVTWSAADVAGHQATPCRQRVEVTAAALNNPPRANKDLFLIRLRGKMPVTIAAPGVLRNDSDPEKAKLSVADTTPTRPRIIKLPPGATLSLYFDGRLLYTPGYNRKSGTVEFSYRASDGKLLSDPARVRLLILD